MIYDAPLDDLEFVLFDLFDAETQWASMPSFAGVDRSLVRAVFSECGKLARDAMLPLNQSADEEGARWEDGEVFAPAGFKDAFALMAEGGWLGVSGNPEYGGQGLPKMLTVGLEEMLWGANSNLYLYATLTVGAAICLDVHGSEEVKNTYLPKFYAGSWTGAMALTENHAGTDLGLMRTRAEPEADGSYRISGSKIFITSGEHDLAENIVHLVLAKLPDAPEGSRGISLFLVPKFLPDADGEPGQRNTMASGSIEHKMGVRGSATSVMNYDGATGYLIGEANRGLECMFTMMNYERLSVGLQGLGLAELAYQNSADYAKQRLQGRSASGPRNPDAAADSILVHPDVRRMLLTQRAFNEGGRAFAAYAGLQLDIAHYGDDGASRRAAADRVGLLTPIAKAFLTDRGLDCAVLAQQVLGGHGYIREWGLEQIVRDVRISQIYEGTNGVQALDLLARKVLRDGGAALLEFVNEMRDSADSVPERFAAPLHEALDRLVRTTSLVVAGSQEDPELAGSASTDYLELCGLVMYGWLWGRMAGIAGAPAAKVQVADFFFAKLLPKTAALEMTIGSGSVPVMAFSETDF